MFVEYWWVGATQASIVPMSAADISGYLVADWVPSLPVAVGSAFIGWPPFLIDTVPFKGSSLLTLREEAGRSERQWKGVLSWMLGVAGTRHALKSENYRWIAPLSAFYPDARQTVDLSTWNASFPRGVLTASRNPQSSSRLRPDYVALRSTAACQPGGQFDWAVAESKGTQRSLASLNNCPPSWANQARNIILSVNLTFRRSGTRFLPPPLAGIPGSAVGEGRSGQAC